ncbi:hypothetical protein RRG08_032933 [Elysia crispata]|uniref:Uncharacterized protein n=1 Tax=Elysia crispata TaxID=231223 RepID=A0AAE1A709_9GAST|nr:hypothetical protein RRG08_032933 [Elysia crispata]
MLSVGMVINNDDYEHNNIVVPEIRLPNGKVLTQCYLGLENRIFEEVEHLLKRHVPGANPSAHQMRVTNPSETVVLQDLEVVETYYKLLENSSYVTVQLISSAE